MAGEPHHERSAVSGVLDGAGVPLATRRVPGAGEG